MRTRIYVDGFNLYYGALRGTALKWLDPIRLTDSLNLPFKYRIDRLRYFTAHVSGKLDPEAPRRQRIYLKALETLPQVDIHYGSFISNQAWRPLANLPVADMKIKTPKVITLPQGNHQICGERPQTLPVGRYPVKNGRRSRANRTSKVPIANAVIAEFHNFEEKGSDVNLATHLLNDAWKGLFEAAVVISNDTDLLEPIRVVQEDLERTVVVVCPSTRQAKKLRELANHVRHIRRKMLEEAQFPVRLPNTDIIKPCEWDP